MTTIRQIAEKAGVSKSTVSLALKRDSRCSAKTIETIEKVAKEMGYRPNPLVKANMANMRMGTHRKNIQSILAYFYDTSRGSPYELESFKGASKRADELGFALEAFSYNEPGLSPKRLLQILRSRNVQGILIGETPLPIELIEFNWDEFAVATIGYTLQNPQVDRIGYDHVENMNHLYDDLHRRGYQRVGLAVRSDFDNRITHSPIASYLRFQFEQSLSEPLQLYVEGKNWKRAAFLKWFRANKPDCIVTVGNEIGEWLTHAKIRIPEDVGVFSIWGNLREEELSFSHFKVSIEQLARTTIDVISDQLNSNSRGIPQQRRSILISGEIAHLNSLRSIAK